MTPQDSPVSRMIAWAIGVLISSTVVIVGGPARAEIIAETKPFVSPKGPFVNEQASYHTFRIPGMVVAADGSVLTFAEGRRGTGADPRTQDDAPMDLVMRRSTDNGQTWEDLVILDSGFKTNGARVDFGDPTPVLDKTTGAIHLLYGQWPDKGPITADWGQDPDSADDNQVVWVQSSSDNGQTWSGPTQINYPDEPGETADGLYWRNAEPGPGSGIQLQWQTNSALNGRLVIPAKRSASSTPSGSVVANGFVYYSDDHGATWQVGDTASAGGNENEVVELTSGNLLLDARATPRTRFASNDGGNTWSNAPASDVPITGVDASMIRYSAVRSGEDRDRLLFSGPGGTPIASGSGRSNQLVWTSYDEGQTFINPVQFNSEQAAYSVLAKLNDGTIGMIVESTGNEPFNLGQNYGDITYFNFDLAELEKANHVATMSHYDGFGNSIDSFRGGVGWSGSWANNGADVQPGGLEFNGFFTEGDDDHAHLSGADMTRNLGAGEIDLNTNQDFFVSLFVRRVSDGADSLTDEWLDVRLTDGTNQQFAFGVSSDEAFLVRNENGSSSVASSSDMSADDTTYLLLAKIAAQDDTNGNNFDQISLAWFNDAEQLPASEDEVDWQLVGSTGDNLDATIDQIFIGGGANADWLVDALRIGTSFDAVVVDTGVGPPLMLGDLNSDRLIDVDDWLIFRGNMLLDTSVLSDDERLRAGDFDVSGMVDPGDFLTFVDLFNSANGDGAFAGLSAVPEPSPFLLAAICGLLGALLPARTTRITE